MIDLIYLRNAKKKNNMTIYLQNNRKQRLRKYFLENHFPNLKRANANDINNVSLFLNNYVSRNV